LNNDQNADWLSSYGRTAEIGFDPICYGTNGGYGAMAAGTAMAQWNFSRMQRHSYGAYVILTEFS